MKIQQAFFLFFFSLFTFFAKGQTHSENYVKTTVYQTETISGDVPSNEKIESINYYDGVGRIKQSIQIGSSGNYDNDFTEGDTTGTTDTRSSQVSGFVNDWTAGYGGTPFYNRYGLDQENNRTYGSTPQGTSDIVWECINDASAGNSDGGFNTNYFNIDKSSGYTFTLWVKRGVNITDGGTYFGTSSVSSLSGTPSSNPYFIVNKDLPTIDEWYLMVGMIHSYDYKGGDLGISGIYDTEGNKVIDGVEWKWNTNTTNTRMRAYLVNASDVNTRQYFWNPAVQKNLNAAPTGWEYDWREGVGSTPFYNKNGSYAESKRTYGEAPNGNTEILWKCDNDATSDSDGGWNTDYFQIDPLKKYRYATWVKRTGSHNGKTYHGTQLVNDLNGTAQSNPYFWTGDLPTLDEWYLLVGVVHPSNYNGGDTGESGVYDSNGNRVIDGKEFKWPSSTVSKSSKGIRPFQTRMRSYFYYSTDTNTKQYFWNPIFEEVTSQNDNISEEARAMLVSGGDIISHYEYDNFGRRKRQYLPYASEVSRHGNIVDNPLEELAVFYNTEKYELTQNPYSENSYINSNQNRINETGAPGSSWVLNPDSDLDHTIKFEYGSNTNADAARLFRVTFNNNRKDLPLLVEDQVYAEGDLYKVVTKDENWTPAAGSNHTTEEFVDKSGRVILKRSYNNNFKHDSYYIYDNYGNLTFVVPPEAANAPVINLNVLDNLCYQYRYDGRNRLVEKKIPGKGWEHIVYNKLDKPVLTQDALLRGQGKWLFTKYDKFGRVAYTGMIANSNSRLTLQNTSNNNSTYTQYETRSSEQPPLAGTELYYSNTAIPTGVTEIYTINYYDNYDWDWNYDDGLNSSPQSIISYGVTANTNVNGLGTGSKIRVLGTDDWIINVSSFDAKGRPIYAGTYNSYLEAKDETYFQLDFIGRILVTTHTHDKGNAIEIENSYEYDQQGRLLVQDQIVNQGSSERIVQNNFDELGLLTRKDVGGQTNGNIGGLQNVDYKYNIRGWLTHINDVDQSAGSDDLFNFEVVYEKRPEGETTSNSLFNGNIAQTKWRTLNFDSQKRGYGYKYDALNRIVDAESYRGDELILEDVNGIENVNYDQNGNIQTLTRYGYHNAHKTEMDKLAYTYAGNQLTRVQELSTTLIKDGGFKDGHLGTTDYTYDDNGNLVSDLNKNITGITYNHLNLPTEITIADPEGGTISYIYDATGLKLQKVVNPINTNLSETTSYTGNYIYKRIDNNPDTLQMFFQPEGYVEPDGADFKYVYNHTDHLGNVRLTYADTDGNGSINPSTEIISEKNYYPFGMQHMVYNDIVQNENSVAHNFGFSGKENNLELGIKWMDFGARNYDSALGRWMNLDPLAEKYFDYSPYNFTVNNPIVFIDPDGKQVVWAQGLTGEEKQLLGAAIHFLRNNSKTFNKAFSELHSSNVIFQVGKSGESWGLFFRPAPNIEEGEEFEYEDENGDLQIATEIRLRNDLSDGADGGTISVNLDLYRELQNEGNNIDPLTEAKTTLPEEFAGAALYLYYLTQTGGYQEGTPGAANIEFETKMISGIVKNEAGLQPSGDSSQSNVENYGIQYNRGVGRSDTRYFNQLRSWQTNTNYSLYRNLSRNQVPPEYIKKL